MVPPSTRSQERHRATRSASPAPVRGRGRGTPPRESRGRGTRSRGTRSVPPESPRRGLVNQPSPEAPVISQTADAGDSLLPQQLPTGSRPPIVPSVQLPMSGYDIPPLGEHLGLPQDPRPTQFTISMEDIRTISRQIAREEIELAKESLRGNYQDMQSSLVATAVPIVFRRVAEGLQERVHEEIEKSILHSQEPTIGTQYDSAKRA